jgi:hypothetical protein
MSTYSTYNTRCELGFEEEYGLDVEALEIMLRQMKFNGNFDTLVKLLEEQIKQSGEHTMFLIDNLLPSGTLDEHDGSRVKLNFVKKTALIGATVHYYTFDIRGGEITYHVLFIHIPVSN